MARATASEQMSGDVVFYTGTSDVREISKKDWASIGVNHPAVRWDKDNRFAVPTEGLSQEVMDYLLNDDGMFKVVAADRVPRLAPAQKMVATADQAGSMGSAVGTSGDPGGAVGGST